MATETTPRLMMKTEYARRRSVSKPFITKLAKNGVLVLRGGKVDCHASDTVLDDKPVDDVDPPPAQASLVGPPQPTAESLGQAGDARCYAYAALKSLIAGRFRLNKQAQHIEALITAKSAGYEACRQPVPQPAGRQERQTWLERRDWFDRRSDY